MCVYVCVQLSSLFGPERTTRLVREHRHAHTEEIPLQECQHSKGCVSGFILYRGCVVDGALGAISGLVSRRLMSLTLHV